MIIGACSGNIIVLQLIFQLNIVFDKQELNHITARKEGNAVKILLTHGKATSHPLCTSVLTNAWPGAIPNGKVFCETGGLGCLKCAV